MRYFWVFSVATAVILGNYGTSHGQYRSSAARMRDLEERIEELIRLNEEMLSKIDGAARRVDQLEANAKAAKAAPPAPVADLSRVEVRLDRLERMLHELEGAQRRMQASDSGGSDLLRSAGRSVVSRESAARERPIDEMAQSQRLAGKWRLHNGDQYLFEPRDGLVRIRLISSDSVVSAEGYLAPGANGAFKGLVTGVLVGDPLQRKRSVNLVLQPGPFGPHGYRVGNRSRPGEQ